MLQVQDCVCIHCGRRVAGDDLRFDLTGIIVDSLRKRFPKDEAMLGLLDALETRWKQERLGPTMISEKTLKNGPLITASLRSD